MIRLLIWIIIPKLDTTSTSQKMVSMSPGQAEPRSPENVRARNMSKRAFDNPADWTLRLGEIRTEDYIIVFGYVKSSDKGIYVRLYNTNEHQIFGRMLTCLEPSTDGRHFVNAYRAGNDDGLKTQLPPDLYNIIKKGAEKFEALRVFA